MSHPMDNVGIEPVPCDVAAGVDIGRGDPTVDKAGDQLDGVDPMVVLVGQLAGHGIGILRGIRKWLWPYRVTEAQIKPIRRAGEQDYEDAARGWALTAKWCARSRAQFGYVSRRTKVNEDAVRVWLQKEMSATNVRICDRLKVIPYAVAAVFVPSEDEILASRIHSTRFAKQRRAAVDTAPSK